MNFDFNWILLPLTILLGLGILLDKIKFKQRKTKGAGHESSLIKWSYEFFPIIAILFVVRAFIIEPFNIPSSSMVPTLYTGDFIAVNKYSYGIRIPLLNQKIINTGEPQHGDVAVFRYPENPKIYYIKRIIGLPGDTVSYDNGVLSVNGKPIVTTQSDFTANPDMTAQLYPPGRMENGEVLTPEEAKKMGLEEEKYSHYLQETQGNHTHLVRYLGDLNSAQYATFLQKVSPEVVSSQGTKWQVTVPQGEYFVMGDNRDRSADGRWWGFVPDENLAGKAVYVWMHKQAGFHLPTFSRNGKIE